jgi:hypothetical protein
MDERIGDNINGPSLIRVPEWVADPLGRYYLYFAHHNGVSIRLAYADQLEGPWSIYPGGVLPLEQSPGAKHVASPDVHVDMEHRRIRMYFHSPPAPGSGLEGQKTWAAVSDDGLRFEVGDTVLGEFYFRVFQRGEWYYALAKRRNDGGLLYRSRDALAGFERGPTVLSRVRHTAVWLDRDNALPRRLEIHEESGATRTLSLFRIRVNESLPNQTFAFKPPKGVRVVDQ